MILEEFRFCESKLNGKDDSLSIDFAFLSADETNLNKRRYPLAVVEKALSEAQKRLKQGNSLYGASSHPKNGSMELNDVSHLIERLWMRDKLAFAAARILPTTTGKNLAVILRGGGKLGVSARGNGTCERKGDVDVVNEYELHSIDFVCSPSFNTFAGLKEETLFESIAFGFGRLTEADLKARYCHALSAGYKGSFVDYLRMWRK